MFAFYVDESGCTGVLPTATAPIQPVFALGGLILDRSRLADFTMDWLHLKERFFPGLRVPNSDFLDWIAEEIKGAELRKQVRGTGRNPRRHALGFMDKALELLERHRARLLARVYVKPIAAPFNGRAVYTSSIQILAGDFQQFLAGAQAGGLMILDSRNKPKNTNVSHSVFTQKFRSAGDAYDRLVEMPVFGHSDNHAGIQAADLICSAFLFPMAAYVYCQGKVNNLHVHLPFFRIRDLFGERLKRMQYRYQDAKGFWRGGITVSDGLGRQHGRLLRAMNLVFTIGHSTHTPEAFTRLLQMHGVEALADVRSSPFSRFNPQFNREAMEQSLKANGIRYVFLGKELGARSEDRSCYLDGRVQYARLARTPLFQSGLERVLQGAARYRVALMCAEKEPLECHRTLLVAKALAARGQPVLHIHADGHLETHGAAMERLLDVTGLPKEDLFRSKGEILAEALARQEQQVAYVDEAQAAMTLREDSP